MRSNSNKRPACAGSTILMGLAIMSLATIGITAWVALIGARASSIESMEAASRHRLNKLNARAITEEYIYRNVVTKAGTASATITIPGGVGVITVPATTAPFASVALPGGIVRTGQADGYGYHVGMPVTYDIALDHDLDPGTAAFTDSYQRDFLIKSRAPQFSGDLMIQHKPTREPSVHNDITGRIQVYGNLVAWTGTSPHTIQNKVLAARFITPTTGSPGATLKAKDLSNSWAPASNFALMSQTGGDWGTGNGYEGTLNVIDPGPAATWSMKNQMLAGSHIFLTGDTAFDSGRGASSDGSGTIDITLGDIHLGNVLIQDHVDTINFHGQDNDPDFADANLRGAIMIIYHQTVATSANLTRINFNDRNNRRVSLGIKKDQSNGEVELKFPQADATWRMVLTAENTRMKEKDQPNGTVTITGGVRTDRDFKWDGSNNRKLAITRETDPKLLERIVPRTAWLESYAN